MFKSLTVLGFTLTLVLASATAQTAPDKKSEKEFQTAKDRETAIRNAVIFQPKAVSEANILQGPKQQKDQFQLHFGDKVICDFATPGSQMGGRTQKFGCKITRVESSNGQVQTVTPDMDEEEPVKVKFGDGDNEVFAEPAATRLLWALGFYADSWFPVTVECHNCPADVESGKGAAATRTFAPAIVVRKYKGHKMYEAGKPDEGWSWKELAQLSARPSYEKDGLALLGAFLVHSDNKPPQQRLVCDHVKDDKSSQPPTVTCDTSIMLVQDVGATFGGGGAFTNNDSAKMNLEKWTENNLWKKVGKNENDCPECQARLRKSFTAKDGLDDPMVSEEGRRFLAGLMCQLTDTQIADLFRLSQLNQMPRYRNAGLTEDAVIKEWVDAFKKKREDLAAGRCMWKTKPADLKVVENPAGLATVPNYCSASPF